MSSLQPSFRMLARPLGTTSPDPDLFPPFQAHNGPSHLVCLPPPGAQFVGHMGSGLTVLACPSFGPSEMGELVRFAACPEPPKAGGRAGEASLHPGPGLAAPFLPTCGSSGHFLPARPGQQLHGL